jgi:hypothetical protein
MSRNGSGVYTLPAGNPVVTATTISSTWANNTLTDIANALTGSLSADGQTPLTGNLNANNNKLINLLDPTLAQDAVTLNYLTTQPIPFAGNITAPTQTTGNNTTRVATTAFVQSAVINSSSIGKNRIINGAMVIDQRNAGAGGSTIGYTVDRFGYFATQASKFTWGQNLNSVTPPVNFSNYLGFQSSSAYSVISSDYFGIQQRIEGFNTSDLGFGTVNAKTVTLSFQVYSSLTGTFGGALQNSNGTRSYPFTYSVPTANTWTTVSVTVAGDTTGTWVGATNGIGLIANFNLGAGSTFSGTAGSWASANYTSATGSVSIVGTSGATFYITSVQLETGVNASSFEFRQYGTELLLCQRYFQKSYEDGTALGAATTNGIVGGYIAETAGRAVSITFQVPLRATATIAYWDGAGNASKYSSLANNSWVNNLSAAFVLNSTSSKGVILSATSGAAGSTGFIQYSATAEL